jgi:hypothetical protein
MLKKMLVMMAAVALAACQMQPIEESSGKSFTGFTAKEDAQRPIGTEEYSRDEVQRAAEKLFGETSEGLAKAIERAFSQYGAPTAYIAGEEGGGALVAGIRYGQGTLTYKAGGSLPIWWQGASVGFDFGGNASKVFTLIYNLRQTYDLFQRFPSVDGSLYLVAGFGLNYQRSGNIVLAPIRSGVGLRAGASVGYVHYTAQPSINPF